jgi:thioredoxin 1
MGTTGTTNVELTAGNFRPVVGVPGIVLVACWAPECRVCIPFDMAYRRAAERHPDLTFARMNVATDERLGDYFEIEYTPTLMLYRDGLLLMKKPGNFTEAQLEDFIRQAASLDMTEVRAGLEPSRKEASAT